MTRRTSLLVTAAPVVFVLLWSTGFIGAKYGLPYAEPFTFLAVRMVLATSVLGVLIVALRADYRLTAAQIRSSIIVGTLIHGGYLGGVFYGIANGLPAGVSAVIVSLQPVLVAVLAVPLLGERLTRVQLAGLVVGVVGVSLVLTPGLTRAVGTDGITTVGLISGVIALLGGTLGTLAQKRTGAGIPMLAGTAVQYLTSGIIFVVAASATESFRIDWSPHFVFAWLWLSLVLSIGAILLLFFLLRQGSAARVSSLYYLVPPVTSVEAFLLFNERLAPISLLGVAVTAIGVSLVLRTRKIAETTAAVPE